MTDTATANGRPLAGDPCPDSKVLRSYLLGRVREPESGELDAHLSNCRQCQLRLVDVDGDDELVRAVRAGPGAVDATIIEAADRLAARLCRDANRPVETDAATIDWLDPPDRPSDLGRLGPYRVVAVLGHGGMGVVLRAEDTRLPRTVALKVLLDQRCLSADYRARFAREAATLARLQHPNIVQVFETSEHRGRPYLALEFVAGGALAARLGGEPQPPAIVTRLMIALARALAAAHALGIVHRDLKPANILMSGELPGGSLLAPPKVTDFGLARDLASPALTETGDVLGTPGYMAPEMIGTGRGQGPAADVYSLGAILYELLTGRPPFRGDTPFDTLKQSQLADPAPPRRLSSGVPRDLETICMKCLDRSPGRRYASAATLLDDLERFSRGEPIRARPVPTWERAGKWARRRPAAAALIGACAVFLTVLIGDGLMYQERLRQEVSRAEDGEAQALRQRQRADAQYREARQTLQTMLDRLRRRAASDIPRLKDLQRAQLEDALTFYLRAAEQTNDDPAVRADAALALLEAGKLQQELGRRNDARPNLERARDDFATLADQFPDRAEYRSRLARCLSALGDWHASNPAEATGHHRQALALYKMLAVEQADVAEYRAGEAKCYHNLGGNAFTAERYEEAEKHFRKAEHLREDLLRQKPDDIEQRTALAQTQLNLSMMYQTHLKRPTEMRVYHERAEATLEDVLRRDPGDHVSARSLAMVRNNWAYVLAHYGQADLALADLDKNVALLEPLLRQEPNVRTLRDALYRTHGVRANMQEGRNRWAEAVEAWRQVVDLALEPSDQIVARLQLANALARAGLHAEAFATVETLAVMPENREGQRQLHLAQVCGWSAAAAGNDLSLSPDLRNDLVDRYAARAVVLLAVTRAALDNAAWRKQISELLSDPALIVVRPRADFQKLIQ